MKKSLINAYVSRDGENFVRADLDIDIKYGVMSFYHLLFLHYFNNYGF